MPWRLLKLRRKSPCTPSDEVADLDSGSGQWMINKHLCNTCMLQISHVHMPGCPSFIYAFVHFFLVVHLNLCTWNGWCWFVVREKHCYFAETVRLFKRTGPGLGIVHIEIGSLLQTTEAGPPSNAVTTSWDQSPSYMEEGEDVETCWPLELVWGALNKQAASGEVSPWLTILQY